MRSTAADQSIGRYLLPRLLAFVTHTDRADPEHARTMVSQTLTAFVVAKSTAAAAAAADAAADAPTTAAAGRTAVSVAMALVIPALLARAAGELQTCEDERLHGRDKNKNKNNSNAATTTADDAAIYREASGRLLELASADPAAFRSVVGGLAENQRAFMEDVIKAGRQPDTSKTATAATGQPTIALKMNFGGGD